VSPTAVMVTEAAFAATDWLAPGLGAPVVTARVLPGLARPTAAAGG
jgi:hypothetical protein